MREYVLTLGMIACFFVLPSAGWQNKDPGYELYSWQKSAGEWNFSILPHTSRNKTVKEVFDTRRILKDLDELKAQISKLPEKTTVFWIDRIPLGSAPKAKGSEPLKFPPSATVDTVKRHAATRGITVEIFGQPAR